MSRNSTVDYTKFVHEYETSTGELRYGVGQWNPETGQYTCPMDSRTSNLTGCFAYFAPTIVGLGGPGYNTRKAALRRARYLFGPDKTDYSAGY
jgi:hypothetical protein